MTKNNNHQEFNPPYISLPRMKQVFELLSNRNFFELTINNLEDRGFTKSDASQALQGIRFLGLLTPDGKTTELMKVLQLKGESKQEKFKEVIKNAYKKLFDITPNADSLSRDQLFNEFLAIYNLSPRLARTAVPAFLWLCKEAGMNVLEELPTKELSKKPQKTIKQGPVKQRTDSKYLQESDDIFLTLNIANTGIRLQIPKNVKVEDAIAAGGLTGIRLKIIEFAKKVGLQIEEEKPMSDPEN